MSAFLTRNTQVALKQESTEGTPETVSASDAGMTVYDASFSPSFDKFSRKPARGTLTGLAGITGKTMGSISWSVDLMGSGDVTAAPTWGPALECCGFDEAAVSTITCGSITGGPFEAGETITGGTSSATGIVVGRVASSPVRIFSISGTFQSAETITGGTSGATATTSSTASSAKGFIYTPDSSAPPSATVALYQDGVRHQIFGARGNVSVTGASANGPAKMAFTFQGVYDATTDAALLSGIAYENVVPEPFKGVTAYLHGADLTSDAVFGNFSFDMGNSLVQRESAASSKGALSVFIADRTPTGSIDPELTLVATHDFFGRFENSTAGGVEVVLGSTAGNTVVVSGPNTTYTNVSLSDRGGIVVAGVDLEFVGAAVSSSDSELQIAMV